MDPAAVLVAILVFLVFGFLFGNIALCVVFISSFALFVYSHTHSFQLTQIFPRILLFSNFPIFNTRAKQILVRAEKVRPGRREEAEEEDWREEEEDAADEERDAAAGVV
jgi:hypothetical protein